MSSAHLAGLDLNLLRALDALLRTRHVTRAALSAGVTQSAMSHSLARLRQVFADPLLVRVGGHLAPTERALLLAPRLRAALSDLEGLFVPALFDPQKAQRTFRITTSDYAEIVLLPVLYARLAVEAPGIDLRFFGALRGYAAGLGTGQYDLAVTPITPDEMVAGLQSRRLLGESFVCVVRRGHPLTRKPLTLARFADAKHALIAPRGEDGSFVDEALARLGTSRRVAVRVPNFMTAPHLVARSDLVLTLAARVAVALADPFGLALLDLPKELAIAPFSMSLLWHERHGNDPGHVWFRNLFAEVAGAIPAPRRPRRRRGAS